VVTRERKERDRPNDKVNQQEQRKYRGGGPSKAPDGHQKGLNLNTCRQSLSIKQGEGVVLSAKGKKKKKKKKGSLRKRKKKAVAQLGEKEKRWGVSDNHEGPKNMYHISNQPQPY